MLEGFISLVYRIRGQGLGFPKFTPRARNASPLSLAANRGGGDKFRLPIGISFTPRDHYRACRANRANGP